MNSEAVSDNPPVAAAASPDELQAAADVRREARDWVAAAQLYAQVVALRPEAWGLTVQEGHCLKESGDVRGALARYKAAEVVAPDDADLQLQIGHAHKLLGQWHEAALCYARAVSLDPGNPDAWRESSATSEWLLRQGPATADTDILAMTEAGAAGGYVPPTMPAPRPPAIPAAEPFPPLPQAREVRAPEGHAAAAPPVAALPAADLPDWQPRPIQHAPAVAGVQVVLDVTDVLDYFNGARAPTGIQRVQIGIVNRAIAEGAPEGLSLSFAAYSGADLSWHVVDAADFARVCALSASGFETEDPEWITARDTLARKVSVAPVLGFAPGAMLVNLGNSWGFADYFRALRTIQREYGVRYLPFVHDCVPLIVPEHCLQDTVQLYSRWFGGMALHAHGVLCNSENTLRDVQQHLQDLLPGLDLPGHVVRLDADPRAVSTAGLPETTLPALRVLRPREEFALFVSTIESRKNHLLVFNAWLQLLRKHGPAKVPRLVCVGRLGWHSEAALALLQNAPELQRHVVLMSKISDQELDALYERCAFTVYNSHYEGWGLPITEALSHGKIVVTARHSALTEAGGEAAIYFTPQSQPDLQDKLEQVIFDRDFRAAQEAIVREKGQPRSWSAVKEQALTAVLDMARQPARPLEERVRLVLGQRYRTRNAVTSKPKLPLAIADAVRDGTGWYPAEDWGVWCRPGLSTLRLPLPPEAVGAALRLYLEFQSPPAVVPVELRCSLEGAPGSQFQIPMQPGRDTTFMIDLPAAPGAELLEVEIDNGRGVELASLGVNDPRTLGAALRAFMLCRHDDHAARLAFLESQSFMMAEP
jgi:glycosyltransferase involved in cell wall biosynthesis